LSVVPEVADTTTIDEFLPTEISALLSMAPRSPMEVPPNLETIYVLFMIIS
jgi:hypothetical protein